MRKLSLLLFCALFFSCVSTDKKTISSYDTYNIPLESTWNLYVFDIDSKQSLGRAFIAGNTIWSAKHIFSEFDPGVCNDIENLGYTKIHGLNLCDNKHKINDLLYYRSKTGIKYLLIVYVEEEFFGVIPLSPIICGESGSPVMCLKDNAVVGIVSHLLENEANICIGGEISRIHLPKYE